MQPVTSHVKRVESNLRATQPVRHQRTKTKRPEIACQPGTPTTIQTESTLQLALQVLVLVEPGLDVRAVTLNPDNLGADGVEALLDGTVVAL